jgi:hypothetical protein
MLLLAITAGLLGFGVVVNSLQHPTQPESKVTLQNYEQLRVGMKEGELHRLLGHPSRRDDSIVPKILSLQHRYEIDEKRYPQRYFWEAGEDVIWATVLSGTVQQFGGTLEGVRYGDDVTAPLIRETNQPDDDAVTTPGILETKGKDE